MTIPSRPMAVPAFFAFFCLLAIVLPFKTEAVYVQPLIQAPPYVQQAYAQVSADFDIYQEFLQVEESPGGLLLLNARTPYEAQTFLSRGFSVDLADAICSSFTRYDIEREHLMLIPCDGLPTIGAAQKNGVLYYMEGQDSIIFQYRFEDCYQPGDAYLYCVRTRLEDGWWKVEALELLELNHNVF